MAMLETSGMLSVQRMAALPKMLALLLAGELMCMLMWPCVHKSMHGDNNI